MSDQPRRCPYYGGHAELIRTVIHDHEDGLIYCGIMYQCPECRFQEWAVMPCDGDEDEEIERNSSTYGLGEDL